MARISGKRKKRTASRKPRSKKDTKLNEDHGPPSEATWATMASYGSFVGEYLTTSQAAS